MKCEICNKEVKSFNGLGVHISKVHDISSEEYYIKYINSDAVVNCPYCLKKLKFRSFTIGFNKTCGNQFCKDKNYKNINLKKYGVESILKFNYIRDKRNKIIEEKYGVKNVFQLTFVKEKSKNTCLKNFGVDNPTKSKEIQLKQFESKKLNGTTSSSKTENKLYEYLCSQFPNVHRNYKSVLYPFYCDFYIEDLDLYIELNAHWSHGFEEFNSKLKKHKEILLNWKNKNTEFYNSAIKVWTKADPLKRKTAKQNNLNYIEIFTNDFDKAKFQLDEIIRG